MIFKLAYRNLARNRWRTGLTMAGVAVAVALLVWTLAYMEGFQSEMIRGSTAVELGQVVVEREEYVEKSQMRFSFAVAPDELEQLEATPGIVAASPRVRAFGLVGNEERSVVARLVGVEPRAEKETTVVAEGLVKGRWLNTTPPEYPAPREAVVGKKFADQLEAEIGTELVVLFEAADGSMGNDLIEVVGIVETQNAAVDRQTVYLHLEDLQYAAALEGKVHEIAIRVEDVLQADQVATAVGQQVGSWKTEHSLVTRDWRKMLPSISQMLEVSNSSDIIMYILVYMIVAFGLFNAQRMSALERTREFGVILAVGVSPWQLFMTVLLETVFITLAGALAGAGLGAAISFYHQAYGLDISGFLPEGTSMGIMGVSFSKTLTFEVTPRVVYRPVLFILPVAFLCGLWPAYKSATLRITNAITGRQ